MVLSCWPGLRPDSSVSAEHGRVFLTPFYITPFKWVFFHGDRLGETIEAGSCHEKAKETTQIFTNVLHPTHVGCALGHVLRG